MNGRIKTLRLLITIIMVLLLARSVQLQIVSGDYYYQLSEGNRTSHRPINSPRGKIVDREGRVLVSNKLSQNLYLLPNEIPPNLTPLDIIKRIDETTDLEYSLLEENYHDNEGDRYSSAILLKRNISSRTMVLIEENRSDLPGALVKESLIRDYVKGQLASHLIGYVGQISKERLVELNEKGYNYSGSDIVGISGLERQYETYLQGEDGIEQIEVNSKGKKVQTLGIKPPEPGNDLVLNIDVDLQQHTNKLLQESFHKLRQQASDDEELNPPTGAGAIVMEVDTGAILSMVSVPTYDLNKFATGISQKEYKKLNNDSLNPLLDRITMGLVPPGSIFKLVTGTAAIEYLGIDGETEFVDENGKFYIPNWDRPFRNWFPRGEGKLDFTRAIARSNNIVFYELGYRLYKKYRGTKLVETARQYGLGEPTGIDLPSEKAGLVPDRKWKQKKFGEGWYPGDSVNLSIGQGGLLTTPLQLITMVNSITNKGKLYQPYLVDKIVNKDGEVIKDFEPTVKKQLPFSQKTYQILIEGMKDVTNQDYGTASGIFGDFPVKVAGKTGTAESGRTNHGWFVGFAPLDDPEVIVLVFLENGNSSSYTLPIASDIMSYYFGLNKEENILNYNLLRNRYTDNSNKFIDFIRSVFSEEEQEF